MKKMKSLVTMLVMSLMMVFVLGACSKEEDKETETTTPVATTDEATDEATDESADEPADEVTTITEDEAVELVKQELGEEFSFVVGEELEEKDGSQYYVVYVKKLLEEGVLTTQTIYMVKTDGSEVFDKYVADSYVGKYYRSGDAGEVVFEVFEDGTFEMTTTGEVNQVVRGVYEFGITNSASVIKLILYPRENVIEVNGEKTEEDMTDAEGVAIIENGELALTMESQKTIFTRE